MEKRVQLSYYKRRYTRAKKRETKKQIINSAYLNLHHYDWVDFLTYIIEHYEERKEVYNGKRSIGRVA